MSITFTSSCKQCRSQLRHAKTLIARASSTSTWPSRTHLRKPAVIPPPLPAIHRQTVVLSDGSTFTAHTTSPTPAIIRLTRDVTNNPLWAPATEKLGLGEGAEEGRVGRFRRRFEDITLSSSEAKPKTGFGEEDFDWMSEGAQEEKVAAKDLAGPKGKGKKK